MNKKIKLVYLFCFNSNKIDLEIFQKIKVKSNNFINCAYIFLTFSLFCKNVFDLCVWYEDVIDINQCLNLICLY